MKEKKEKKKYGLILFIIFIMVGTSVSFVYFGFSPAEDKVKYNGITFAKNNNVWIAKINGNEAAFSFLPSDVQNIPADVEAFKLLQEKYEIDITSDVNITFKETIALAEHQMGLTLEAYNIFLRKGFTTNSTFKPPIPIITCSDSTANVPVVYFRSGNATSIRLDNNCIIVQASTNAGFIKVKDRLLYGILGVMK